MLQLKAIVLALPLIALTAAHRHGHDDAARRFLRRAASTTSSSSSSSTAASTSKSSSTSVASSASTTKSTTVAASTTHSTSVSGSGTVSVSSTATTPTLATVPIDPASVNPTAVPVGSILFTMPPQQTVPLFTTATAGAEPSGIANAPPLPDISAWNMAIYPPLDHPPPTDTPEVQAWIAEVQASGVEIPDIAPFNLGGCANNTQRIGNMTECWWTCGHCARTTDVTTCNDKLTWGSSFDDGPAIYTPDLLDYLNAENLKTTFFVVGSRVATRPQYLQTEYVLGHQIAVHTWSHFELTTLTTNQIIAEFGWSKKVIKDAIGVTPNFFRPPYGDIDDRVRAIALAMGLTPVIWTVAANGPFDTFDWEVPGDVVSASQAIAQFESILATAGTLSTGFIVLEHDLFQQTVDLAVGYFLPSALAQTPKLTIVPIGQCIGLQPRDSYVETNNNATHPPPATVGGSTGGNGTSGGETAGAPATLPRGFAAAWGAVVLAGALGAVGML